MTSGPAETAARVSTCHRCGAQRSIVGARGPLPKFCVPCGQRASAVRLVRRGLDQLARTTPAAGDASGALSELYDWLGYFERSR